MAPLHTWLTLVVACLATGNASAQCRYPPVPTGGFAVQTSDRGVTLSDGYKTTALVTWPKSTRPICGWPMILLVHPLGGSRLTIALQAAVFANQGYCVVSHDVRGQGSTVALNRSKGSNLWSLDEWIDMAEIIEWAGSTFSSVVDANNVAVVGDSQGGLHAWAAAAWSEKNFPKNNRRRKPFPKIRAVAARVLGPSINNMWVPGQTGFFYRLAQYAFDPAFNAVVFDVNFRWRLGFYLDADDPAGLLAWLASLPGRDFASELTTSKVPTLAIADWLDLFESADATITAFGMLPATTPRRLVISTGLHATPFNGYQLLSQHGLMVDWCDRFLKLDPEPIEQGPPVQTSVIPALAATYQHPNAVWRARANLTFPPKDRQTVRFWLSSDGLLHPSVPKKAAATRLMQSVIRPYGPRDFAADGLDVGKTAQVLLLRRTTFRSSPFPGDVEIVGRPIVNLAAFSNDKNLQVGARLFLVAPDRSKQLMSSGGTTIRGVAPFGDGAIRIDLGSTLCVVPRGFSVEVELMNQILQRPAAVDLYRVMPLFSEFTIDIHHTPEQACTIDLPARLPSVDLTAGEPFLSLASPQPVRLFLRSDPRLGGTPYLIIASLAGQGPAIPLASGTPMWLSPDIGTTLFIAMVGTPPLDGFLGLLDGNGEARPNLKLNLLSQLPSVLLNKSLHLVPLLLRPSTGLHAGAPLSFRFR